MNIASIPSFLDPADPIKILPSKDPGARLRQSNTSISLANLYLKKCDAPTDNASMIIIPDLNCGQPLSTPFEHSTGSNTSSPPESFPSKMHPMEEEDVSEEFVKKFNEHIGNSDNFEKAKRLLVKMQNAGGIGKEVTEKSKINIIMARDGLCILAGLKNNKLKLESLDSLIKILKTDVISKESAENLVALAIQLTKKMNRELMQTEVLDIQIKIAYAYGLVAELIQRQFSKKKINAITEDLKKQFRNTAGSIKVLNRLEDPHLAFAISYALEGIKRIKSDNRELLEVFARFTHLTTSLGSLYNIDLHGFYHELFTTFKDLNNRHEYVWYNAVLILNEYSKDAFQKPEKLLGIQILIHEKFDVYNWKFLYAGMDILTNTCIYGETAQLRRVAFEGQKLSGKNLPGLFFFTDFDYLSKIRNLSPLMHFKAPTHEDANIYVRQVCIENLIKISFLSPDYRIRRDAKVALLNRLVEETDPDILNYISKSVPRSAQEQKEWLEESGKNYQCILTSNAKASNSKIKVDSKNLLQKKLTLLRKMAFETDDRPAKLLVKSILRQSSLPDLIHQQHTANNFTENSIKTSSSSQTTRSPNKIAQRLAYCLGISPQSITKQISFKGEIRPLTEEGLLITETGMEQLSALILANKEIKSVKLDKCTDHIRGIHILAKALSSPASQVTLLSLAIRIDTSEGEALAEVLLTKQELQFTFAHASDYYFLGKALSKNGLFIEAIGFLTKGLEEPFAKEIDKTHRKLLLLRGKTHMLNDNPALAVLDYQKVLVSDFNDFNAHFELAKAYLDLKMYPAAIASVRHALALSPENTKAMYQLAFFLTRGDMHEESDAEAIRILTPLTLKDTANHDALKLLSKLEKRSSKNEQKR